MDTYFRTHEEGERRMGKAVTDIALKKKLEHFVRETAQNSADAAVEGETPHLIYRYAKIEDQLPGFLNAIGWDTLKEHYAAVAEEDDEIGIQKVIDRIEKGSLPILVVEDQNAIGLTGDEFSKETNYASLLQDFGSSTKDEDEGGVHGVGASVLWGFSGLKTALFLSHPQGWDEDRSPRFVGRIDLPYHESGGEEWQGDGWIGNQADKSRRATSIEGQEALDIVTDELGLSFAEDRLDSTGTTAIVLGFREPNRSRRSPSKVINRIQELVAKYYWPLMLEGGLKVSVQGPDDDDPEEVSPKSVDWLVPFVEAYEKRGSVDEKIGSAPDYGKTTVDVNVPSADEDSDLETEGEVTAVVRTSDGQYDKFDNHVAMFRGARHVVKYRQYRYLSQKTGQNFRGLLVAGRARHPFDAEDDEIPDSDKIVEDFFRKAEPEAHNTWEDEVGKLENHYPGGHEEITDLISDRVPGEIANMLVEAGEGSAQSLGAVGRQFPYFSGGPRRPGGGGGGGGGGSDEVVDSLTRNLESHEDRYECSGELKLTDVPTGDWAFDVQLAPVDAAENQQDSLDSENLKVIANGKTIESSDGPVTISEECQEIEYTQTSSVDSESSGGGKVRVTFDIDVDLEGDS
jgi:RNA polymerase primary sigma factor